MITLEIGKEYYHVRLKIRVKLVGFSGEYAKVEDRSGNIVITLKTNLRDIDTWKPEDILEREG